MKNGLKRFIVVRNKARNSLMSMFFSMMNWLKEDLNQFKYFKMLQEQCWINLMYGWIDSRIWARKLRENYVWIIQSCFLENLRNTLMMSKSFHNIFLILLSLPSLLCVFDKYNESLKNKFVEACIHNNLNKIINNKKGN